MSSVMTRPPARPRPGDNPEPVAAAGNKRTSAPGPGGRIVVGVDDSPAGLSALRWAVSQARRRGASLVAVRSWALGLPRHGGRRHRRRARVHPHVVLYFDGTESRDASVKLVRDSFWTATGGMPRDVTVIVKTPEGDPGAALSDIATARDLIVVGQGEPGLRRVLHGSVSQYCRRHSRCPVVVVPAR
jgi:nucleotide-binding universal stress UspA family protein